MLSADTIGQRSAVTARGCAARFGFEWAGLVGGDATHQASPLKNDGEAPQALSSQPGEVRQGNIFLPSDVVFKG